MAGSLDLYTETLGIFPLPLDLISGAIYWCIALVVFGEIQSPLFMLAASRRSDVRLDHAHSIPRLYI
jgi:hypothetical protein